MNLLFEIIFLIIRRDGYKVKRDNSSQANYTKKTKTVAHAYLDHTSCANQKVLTLTEFYNLSSGCLLLWYNINDGLQKRD